jgi:hypothetical protein
MNAWVWLVAGIGAFFLVLSIIVSLVVAAILGQIGRDVSDLLESAPSAAAVDESEFGASAPLGREAIANERGSPAEGVGLTGTAAPKTRVP